MMPVWLLLLTCTLIGTCYAAVCYAIARSIHRRLGR
jgi:hypothetical protein